MCSAVSVGGRVARGARRAFREEPATPEQPTQAVDQAGPLPRTRRRLRSESGVLVGADGGPDSQPGPVTQEYGFVGPSPRLRAGGVPATPRLAPAAGSCAAALELGRIAPPADPCFARPSVPSMRRRWQSFEQSEQLLTELHGAMRAECRFRPDKPQRYTPWHKGLLDQSLKLYPDEFDPGNDFAFASSAPTLHGERAKGGRPCGETVLSMAEAGVMPPPRALPPLVTPAKRGASSAVAALAERERRVRADMRRHDQRVATSFRREHDRITAMEPLLERFMAVELGPPDIDQLPVDLREPPHSAIAEGRAQFAEPQVVYRDECGKPIQWPWEPERRGSRDSALGDRGQEYAGGGYLLDHRYMKAFALGRPHWCDPVIEQALDAACADRARGRKKTGVRAFVKFCVDLGLTPERPMDPAAPLVAKLKEEMLAMRFTCSLVEDRGVSPETAGKYFSELQGWMGREFGVKFAGGMKLERLPQMLKGLRRIKGDKPKKIRVPISPDALRAAMDAILDPSLPASANIRAAIASAFQGLMRSAEYCGTKGSLMLTRADLVTLTEQLLVIMMHPCKNMHHLAGKTCPLVIGAGGTYIDAVAEVRNMLAVDPTPRGDAAGTPLFRDPATGGPIAYVTILHVIQRIYAIAGLDPEQSGTHILRISGATALFQGGATDTVIRTSGRWSSDLYRLYVRCCYQQCVAWTAKAGSTTFTPTAAVYDEVDDY